MFCLVCRSIRLESLARQSSDLTHRPQRTRQRPIYPSRVTDKTDRSPFCQFCQCLGGRVSIFSLGPGGLPAALTWIAGARVNVKQARFAAEYLSDLNATQAAIRSGYSAKTAYSQGQRLLSHVEVAAEIARGQTKAAKRIDYGLERVLAELASLAFDTEERSQDRIRALELLGKHGGAFIDRSEVKLALDKRIDAPPGAVTYEDWLQQRMGHTLEAAAAVEVVAAGTNGHG